ncbi:endo alpha-1,4 polygalactosaminidase [Cystobacter ferrugineus]|uniref:endo alpha-1,4 polygalactosaminidase n=1 Tax=Cystobacter ferrugineus TaxID=83449 RepID=UPI000A5FB7D2|nr:endo alpha-1,4 polygalactosaminidase [Cystobacter ferrugineus]
MSILSRAAPLVLGLVLGCSGQSFPSDGSSGADAASDISAVDAGASPTDAGTPTSWWRPTPAAPIHWHWQLSQDFSFPRDVLPHKTVYDLDGELTSAETVAKLHALGPDVVVICYFDAGVYEDYRSDKERFPASVIGNPDEGWDGSYWLDIRQMDILLPIMKDRMINWCKNKGFDAIEPDETEVWSNDSGFPITKAQNNAYNKAIAELAHSLGMSVGLKGNNTEAPELVNYFDWALTEQCWEFDECALFKNSFIAQGKAVFNVEYNTDPNCTRANQWHINSSRRDLELVGPTASDYLYQPCVPDTQDTW